LGTIRNTTARTSLGIITTIACTICGAAFAYACPCNELAVPGNPEQGIDRTAGLEFTETKQYALDFQKAVLDARKALEAHAHKEGVAVVSDLDETLLDNRQEIELYPDFNWDRFHAWMTAGRAPLLRPTADLLTWARTQGYAVFFVTGRKEHLRAATIENLVRHNIAYDGLYMRGENDDGGAEQIKVPMRQAIEKLGFRIVLNIGDQWSDLSGGHAENCIKLPNRMYYVK